MRANGLIPSLVPRFFSFHPGSPYPYRTSFPPLSRIILCATEFSLSTIWRRRFVWVVCTLTIGKRCVFRGYQSRVLEVRFVFISGTIGFVNEKKLARALSSRKKQVKVSRFEISNAGREDLQRAGDWSVSQTKSPVDLCRVRRRGFAFVGECVHTFRAKQCIEASFEGVLDRGRFWGSFRPGAVSFDWI